MTARYTWLVAAAAILAASSTARAQRWGHERTPNDGACFYEDADFGGDYFCVTAGGDLSSIPSGMNDRISSVRLFGRTEVTLFKDTRYHGRSTRLSHDVRNLKSDGWNDLVSSIQVRGFGRFGSGNGANDADRVVRRAYQDVLNRDPDTEGLRLYRSRIIDDGWTEQQVREALRKSPEYQKLTVSEAHEIVRRAYQSVLKREPDAGASGYVDKVMRQHWTQADVEKELRKSPEYRRGR